MSTSYEIDSDREKFLQEAKRRAYSDAVEISVREFISKWGAKRRGYWYVSQIHNDLFEFGLRTEPSFEEGWIDNLIRLVPLRDLEGSDLEDDAQAAAFHPRVDEPARPAASETFTFAELERTLFESDGRPELVSVPPDADLELVWSLMMRHDYSQLPVLSGPYQLRGAVTWQSIAKATAHKRSESKIGLKDCIVRPEVVLLEDDVLANVDKIVKHEFVVTRDSKNAHVGVVTTADLAVAFEKLAGPFLMLGVAERLLRSLAEGSFKEESILASRRQSVDGGVPDRRDPGGRPVDELTFAELGDLFRSREQWEALNLTLHRKTFTGMLDDVGAFRNRVMHFRGGSPSSGETAAVTNLITWLRYLTD